MQHLTRLFKLIELARSQPQTGYAVVGIPKDELSNLAEHHYLVAFIAWQLARNANEAGAKLDIEKVLEFALIHDLGEIFGGDLSSFYAQANRRAYRAAKVFEQENQKFLARFFGKDRNYFKKLAKEILDARTDEALFAKAGDFVECTMYKYYVNRLTEADLKLASDKLGSYVKKLKDPVAKKELDSFAKSFLNELPKKSTLEIISETKNL